MESQTPPPTRQFDHLREHSIGLPQVSSSRSRTWRRPRRSRSRSSSRCVRRPGAAARRALRADRVPVRGELDRPDGEADAVGRRALHVRQHALGRTRLPRRAGASCFFQPLVAPLLFLIFAWATEDVVKNELGWDIGWWRWVLVAAAIVFVLTYRDVRLSTKAGIVLGIRDRDLPRARDLDAPLELRQLNLQAFNPKRTPRPATSTGSSRGWSSQSSRSSASRRRRRWARRPTTRAGRSRAPSSAPRLVGLFYVLCSYAWVYGTRLRQLHPGDGEPRSLAPSPRSSGAPAGS